MVDAFCPRSNPVPAGPLLIEFVIGALILLVAIFLKRVLDRKIKAK